MNVEVERTESLKKMGLEIKEKLRVSGIEESKLSENPIAVFEDVKLKYIPLNNEEAKIVMDYNNYCSPFFMLDIAVHTFYENETLSITMGVLDTFFSYTNGYSTNVAEMLKKECLLVSRMDSYGLAILEDKAKDLKNKMLGNIQIVDCSINRDTHLAICMRDVECTK